VKASSDRRVVQQPADVVAGRVRQTGVADLVVEQRRSVLPQRLMAVHARAVVTAIGFGMKVTVLPAAWAVFLMMYLNSIRLSAALEQRAELVVDLGLAGGAHLVVATLDLHAGRLELDGHLVAQVGVVVVGETGK